jgi:hypothetical protein
MQVTALSKPTLAAMVMAAVMMAGVGTVILAMVLPAAAAAAVLAVCQASLMCWWLLRLIQPGRSGCTG